MARPARAARDGWVAAAATAFALAPFLGKAFHVDDPLFLWVARQVQAHPSDPFGFRLVWYFNQMPMSNVTKNPPGASYLLAPWAAVGGWSEVWVHLLFLGIAVAAVLGVRRLALALGTDARVATWATLASPVFLVSATTVMSDVPMLAGYCWALALWVEGIERDDARRLAGAALLAGLAALTKYFACSLLPLFVLYALARRARPARFLPPLAVTLALLGGYQAWTLALYGRGMLLDAAEYVKVAHDADAEPALRRLASGLVFTGGASLLALAFVGLGAAGRRLAAAGAAVAAFALLVPLAPAIAGARGSAATTAQWHLFAAAAGAVLALVALDLWAAPRDAGGWLLAAWVLGTLVFASIVNWTVNGRSVLPLVPAVALLGARALGRRGIGPRGWAGPVAASLAMALAVAWGDAAQAGAARDAARTVMAAAGKDVTWFQGHWGFHWYMQELGARPIDIDEPMPKPGELLVKPINNTNTFDLPPERFEQVGAHTIPVRAPAATMDATRGAGFYAASWGPLPYRIGRPDDETFLVYRSRPAARKP